MKLLCPSTQLLAAEVELSLHLDTQPLARLVNPLARLHDAPQWAGAVPASCVRDVAASRESRERAI